MCFLSIPLFFVTETWWKRNQVISLYSLSISFLSLKLVVTVIYYLDSFAAITSSFEFRSNITTFGFEKVEIKVCLICCFM